VGIPPPQSRLRFSGAFLKNGWNIYHVQRWGACCQSYWLRFQNVVVKKIPAMKIEAY